ncbi:hypothetical protein [Orenia marismortui]|uniref:Uncharacterized protein n=1 Tax=Orenia marismortui TaxID=46469 RepID=A0A4R8H4C2_9FIRM|nr:hypothetical protein [Orenia marismortui]TDX51651.1 hypothetical protein C7959_11147 [Orenia marismortui]
MSDDKLKELSELIGIDLDLLEGLEAKDISDEQIETIESLYELYLGDKEAFSNFLNDSGIAQLMEEMGLEGDVDSPEQVEELKNNLGEFMKKNNLNLDVD